MFLQRNYELNTNNFNGQRHDLDSNVSVEYTLYIIQYSRCVNETGYTFQINVPMVSQEC